MTGWTDGWVDGWMAERMDGWENLEPIHKYASEIIMGATHHIQTVWCVQPSGYSQRGNSKDPRVQRSH